MAGKVWGWCADWYQVDPYRQRTGQGVSVNPIEADGRRLLLAENDQVLLCSDGLTDMVANAAVGAVLQHSGSANVACQTLVELALKNGGKDNVTVVLARYRLPTEEAS